MEGAQTFPSKRKRKTIEDIVNPEESALKKKLFATAKFDSDDDSSSDEDTPKGEIIIRETVTQAVWKDDDDELEEVSVSKFTINSQLKKTTDTKDGVISGKEYEKRLREKYTKGVAISNKPSWALTEEEKAGSDSEDEEAMSALYSMTRSTGKITQSSSNLARTYINVNKQKDITVGHNGNGPLVHVKFHPTRPVLMTAGQKENKICLFEVCKGASDLAVRKGDNFLQDVNFHNYEIGSCDFYNGGQSIFIGSTKKPFFYTYDLIDGKTSNIRRPVSLPQYNYGKFAISDDGALIAFIGSGAQVFVYELKTMVSVQTFSASANVVDVKFAPGDSSTLFGYSVDGAVFIWDLYLPQEQKFFFDEGSVGPTTLAVSRNGQFIACGTGTAIVNVYARSTIEQMTENGETVKPLYTIDNLTTKVRNLAFNHDAQLLAFSSPIKKMSYRLFHVASGTTYQNFPPKQEMLQHEITTSLDFSPHSGFVAFGTMKGFCRLYRLNGFNEY